MKILISGLVHFQSCIVFQKEINKETIKVITAIILERRYNIKMENDDEIKEKMISLIREKARQIYPEKVVNRGTSPLNYGLIENADGYAKEEDDCGGDVEIFIKIKDGKVKDSKFIARGCIFTRASCDVACELAQGKTPSECIMINMSSIIKHLGGLPADHTHCALFAAMIFQRALKSIIVNSQKEQISKND